ncbi:hypothetical protein N7533_005759 [Penicillium manginii]|uniref:uncharacterized protein n=1 Tax=Penicillium manginii TaxID=203109 RepID=UPI0025480A47|nr:uncharacterized protein N7533_005759 [Penicillium manginii]KAJ5756216.1 hypothetical protein N7533_005759 [Penicillium manginii]
MNISLRSSQSSYGDPRYLSTATISDANAPIGKSLVDGYRDAVHPQHDDRSRYNPVRGTSYSGLGSQQQPRNLSPKLTEDFRSNSSMPLIRVAQSSSTPTTPSRCTY